MVPINAMSVWKMKPDGASDCGGTPTSKHFTRLIGISVTIACGSENYPSLLLQLSSVYADMCINL